MTRGLDDGYGVEDGLAWGGILVCYDTHAILREIQKFLRVQLC